MITIIVKIIAAIVGPLLGLIVSPIIATIDEAKMLTRLFPKRIEEILNDKELYEKVQKGAKNDLAKPWSEIAKETYKFYLKMIELNEKN